MNWIKSTDLRLSWRLLRVQPALTALAVLGVAAGIGTATAAFAILNGVFLRALPVPDGDRLMMVWDIDVASGRNVYLAGDEFAYRQHHATAFDHLAAFSSRQVLLEVPGESARPVRAAFLTPNAFDAIRLPPAVGRVLMAADALPGAAPVVVIGHDVWRVRLSGRPDVLGTVVHVAGEPRTIVGVMPPGVRMPLREDVWIPLRLTDGDALATRLMVFGTLRAGLTARQAEEELGLLTRARAGRDQSRDAAAHRVIPFTRGIGGPEQATALLMASAALGLLILVAAANVANLMLARHAARVPEIAVRVAVGAGRREIVVLLLLESLLICLLGAVVGLAGARVALAWFETAIATTSDLPWWATLSIDWSVVAFLVLATVLATAAIGLAPALKVTRLALADVLKQHAGSLKGLRFGRLSGVMIVAEFAIAVACVATAAIIARGLLSFGFTDFRLPADEVLVSQIYFGPAPIPDPSTPESRRNARLQHYEDSMNRFQRIRAGLAALPGVREASLASAFPGNEVETSAIELSRGSAIELRQTRVIEVGEGYFDLLDARPAIGRDFMPAERTRSPRTVIVNERFVRKHLPPGNSLGQRLRLAPVGGGDTNPWLEIIGVVRDLGVNPGDPTRADAVYVPIAATSVARIAVRADGDPHRLAPIVMDLAQRESAAAQVQWSATLGEQMDEVVTIFRRLGTGLMSVGIAALLLSSASLFAIVSFTVTRRTPEIALRVALGASRAGVLRTVLTREVRQLAIGTLAGVGGAAGLLQLVRQIPFDLQPASPWQVAAFVGLMVALGLVACAMPAHRALSIEPMDALRQP